MSNKFVDFVKSLYPDKGFIPLHEPFFGGNEKAYVNECIDSTFVSSVGKYVDQFEKMVAEYTGSAYAVATMNGTAALHISLLLAEVRTNDEVITQPLTFVATANAISYCNARPVFIDVSKETLGLSSEKLNAFLTHKAEMGSDGFCYNKETKNRIKACVPMHTFGQPCEIEAIAELCKTHNISLIEDAAESIGSYSKKKHTGTFGAFGILSFNGNKTITCGGGGMILTQNEALAQKAKHLTTTAKVPHSWEYNHDMVGYNYRLTNINAALGCAQMEALPKILAHKRETASRYQTFFKASDIKFFTELKDTTSNYWLNTILLQNRAQRDDFLKETNENGIMTRPVWQLMNTLGPFKHFQTENIENALYLADRVVNIPSSVR